MEDERKKGKRTGGSLLIRSVQKGLENACARKASTANWKKKKEGARGGRVIASREEAIDGLPPLSKWEKRGWRDFMSPFRIFDNS